mmetsp:Transcript_6057/g.14588  ORF Transcript_6057/g.14588 Transcript_6057/m.14588 type:complete len:319 (+) Transcript_6057:231-1187(+)
MEPHGTGVAVPVAHAHVLVDRASRGVVGHGLAVNEDGVVHRAEGLEADITLEHGDLDVGHALGVQADSGRERHRKQVVVAGEGRALLDVLDRERHGVNLVGVAVALATVHLVVGRDRVHDGCRHDLDRRLPKIGLRQLHRLEHERDILAGLGAAGGGLDRELTRGGVPHVHDHLGARAAVEGSGLLRPPQPEGSVLVVDRLEARVHQAIDRDHRHAPLDQGHTGLQSHNDGDLRARVRDLEAGVHLGVTRPIAELLSNVLVLELESASDAHRAVRGHGRDQGVVGEVTHVVGHPRVRSPLGGVVESGVHRDLLHRALV